MLFNVPIEPIRALNPSQLSKRTALLWDGYIGQDPRRSRTARGVTALTRKSVAHSKVKQSHPRNPSGVRYLNRLRTNLIDQFKRTLLDHHRLTSGRQGCTPEPDSSSEHTTFAAMKRASLLTLKGFRARRSTQWCPPSTAITASWGNYDPAQQLWSP